MTAFTLQEMFDQTAIHLFTQGKRSVGYFIDDEIDYTTCAYRSVDGLKCAVGYWIPDELYDDSLESNIVSDTVIDEIMRKVNSAYSNKHRNLMRSLQKIHDNPDNVDDRSIFQNDLLYYALCNIAIDFKLSKKAIEKWNPNK